jgi:hypothetical protein
MQPLSSPKTKTAIYCQELGHIYYEATSGDTLNNTET